MQERLMARRPSPRGRGRLGPVVMVLAFVLPALFAGRAQGYVLSPDVRWDPEFWPPGGTLRVTLMDSELWRARYEDIGEVRRILQAALDLWASIPTADIRWEIMDVLSEAEYEAASKTRTLRGWVGVRPFATHGGGFASTSVNKCQVALGVDLEPGLLASAAHEFGHCLGLGHAEVYVPRSTYGPIYTGVPDAPSYWLTDPVMSYGRTYWRPGDEFRLTADDMIGASLLRPAPGWLESTGSIRGRVTLPDGEEVERAYVLATRLLEPESASYSVGVSTTFGPNHTLPDRQAGVFEIRGLPPGDYQLLVRSDTAKSFRVLYTWRNQYGYNVVADLRQTLRAGPVRVRAGEESGPVPLAVRRVGEAFR